VWSEYGAELAEDAVSRGIARVALDGPAFQRHLDVMSVLDRPSTVGTASTVQALSTVLETGE
jgi:hypothetical protein